jgi:prevent-host-death family protein
MMVTSTEIKNNFGKYLRLAAREDIIITKNGKKVCKLSSYGEELPDDGGSLIKEQAAAFNYGGKRVSYEEFLEISRNSEERYEYIDGEIYLLASPKTTHQKILMEMSGVFL